MTEASNTLTLVAGGDVGPVIQPVDRLAELILPVLRQADIRMVQCERTYSERGAYQQWNTIPGGQWTHLHPALASIYKTAGIDVLSLASNHAMDWGVEPLLDNIELFRKMGIQTIGAGINDEEARRPVIVERNGVKVAILGRLSVLREGQAAGPNKPGLAAVRARTWYVPIDFQPGCPPLVMSEAVEADVEALKDDIRKAKAKADAVVVFIHWGIRFVPKVIATYQPPLAHAAIDAGADIIIGHHAHVPKAIEVYKGKVCFYSIGNFMTGQSHFLTPEKPHAEWNIFWADRAYQDDPDALYHGPAGSERSILAKVEFSKRGVERVAFLPIYINNLAQPEALQASDPRFNQIVDHMEWASDQVPHTFRVEGNEVVVEGSSS